MCLPQDVVGSLRVEPLDAERRGGDAAGSKKRDLAVEEKSDESKIGIGEDR